MSAMLARGLEGRNENPESWEEEYRPATHTGLDTDGEEGGCYRDCPILGTFHLGRLVLEDKAKQQIDEQPTSTMTIDLPTHVPQFTSEFGGGVVVGQHSETHSSASRYTPTITVTASASTPRVTTITVTVPASLSTQAVDTTSATSTEESTTFEAETETTTIIISSTSATSAEESTTLEAETETTTISISSTSADESTFYQAGPHPTTTRKPLATIAIPEFVDEFTSEYEEEMWNGMHSPTSLPLPVASTYIEPTGGVSVVPAYGPTVYMNPSGLVTMWKNSTGSATTETASPTTSSTSIVTTENGPTVSVDTTGGVSALTGLTSSPTVISPAMTVTLAPGGYNTTANSYALKITSTKTYHITETSTVGMLGTFESLNTTTPETTTFIENPSTDLDPYVQTSSIESDVSMPTQYFTTTLILPLPQASICSIDTKVISEYSAGSLMSRNIAYTVPGCTLGPRSFTTVTTVTSASPSTMLRLVRRSPDHYEGIAAATLTRAEIKALETSLGAKDSSNIVYNDIYAATPQNPWGAAPHAGQLFTEPKDFAGAISMKLVGIVIGGIFGLVCVSATLWFGVKKVQRRRALARGLEIKGDGEQS
ncbi:hypothetical protein E2P81_ATG08384 [Venturia nashicola]|nr:hypothetical protein E2P81_ATG08384 [Venturia nashicola]